MLLHLLFAYILKGFFRNLYYLSLLRREKNHIEEKDKLKKYNHLYQVYQISNNGVHFRPSSSFIIKFLKFFIFFQKNSVLRIHILIPTIQLLFLFKSFLLTNSELLRNLIIIIKYEVISE